MPNKKIIEMREFFESNVTLDYNFRLAMLENLDNALVSYKDRIFAALKEDLNKTNYESFLAEYSPIIAELRYVKRKLRKWMKPKRRRVAKSQFFATVKEYQEPFGVTLLVSPWNYPLLLPIRVLIGSIAAGNCSVLKLSELSPKTSLVIKEMLNEYFDDKYILAFDFGKDESSKLLNENKFDYIFFTGNDRVGQIYLKAAAENLTPCSLELGGKSPVIINQDADIESAIKRIVFGKILNTGQTCVAPDYMMVHEEIKDKFVASMKTYLDNMFESEQKKLSCLPKFIHQRAYDNQIEMLAGQKVLIGGKTYPETRQIDITVVDSPAENSKCMTEEIFGSVFPLFTFKNIDDIKAMVKKHAQPLALYVFTKDKSFYNRIINEISFGGGCINDTIMHITSPYASFGGVGASGMGRYGGKATFDTFSNPKTILNKKFNFDFSVKYHPYTDDRKTPSVKLLR